MSAAQGICPNCHGTGRGKGTSVGCTHCVGTGVLVLKTDPSLADTGVEDGRWQKLRDLLGLDGWHDGHWNGIPNPDQIITHIEFIANERARLLQASLRSEPVERS